MTVFIFILNICCMFFSLWVAFSPRFRPMTWSAFYFNLGAAAINLFSVIFRLLIGFP